MRPEPKLQLILGLTFSVAALAALLLFFLNPGLFLRQAEHRTGFDDVTGLRVGAEVHYAGFVVGRVGAIEPRFADDSFEVTLRLRRDWRPKPDIVAKIDESNPLRPAGVLLMQDAECARRTAVGPARIPGCGRRANVIDMASTVAAEVLRAVEAIKSVVAGFGADGQPGLPDPQALFQRVQQVLDNIEAATAALRQLANAERVDAVSGAIDELSQATARLSQLASNERVTAVGIAIDELSRASARLGALVSEERASGIAAAVDDLGAAAASTRRIAAQATVVMEKANQIDPAQLNRTAKAIERTTGAVGDLIEANQATITAALTEAKFLLQTTSVSLQQVMLQLEEASRSLNDLTQRLRDDPSILLRGRSFRSPGGDGAGK